MKVFDAKITLEEAGLYAFLMSNLDEENYVKISFDEIAKRTCLNKGWLESSIKKLEKADLIYIPNSDKESIRGKRIFCYYKPVLEFPF